MKTWLLWLKENYVKLVGYVLMVVAILMLMLAIVTRPAPTVDVLKDFKDGIQNHLVWSIKGECFFVRPHTETTVYLIRVADCDRK
jgi:hypothetical protein